MNLKTKIEMIIYRELESKHLEDIFEEFDLDPTDVFYTMFTLGYIDKELFERLYEQE